MLVADWNYRTVVTVCVCVRLAEVTHLKTAEDPGVGCGLPADVGVEVPGQAGAAIGVAGQDVAAVEGRVVTDGGALHVQRGAAGELAGHAERVRLKAGDVGPVARVPAAQHHQAVLHGVPVRRPAPPGPQPVQGLP